jgi:hypothetical protein
VTKADPVWRTRRHDSDVAAQATTGEALHAASPPSKAVGMLRRRRWRANSNGRRT